MSVRRLTTVLVATGLATAAAVTIPAAASAAPSTAALGTSSLATLLASDGNRFDADPGDFDILDNAIAAVLVANPDSAVAVLADGSTAVTAFLPTDGAFRRFVSDLTGTRPLSEPAVLGALVNAVGIETVETVLLYHVVPGVTLDSGTVLQSDEAVLTTAQGGTVSINVVSAPLAVITVRDLDPNAVNPYLIRTGLDLNVGNLQIGHAVSLVLRPADL